MGKERNYKLKFFLAACLVSLVEVKAVDILSSVVNAVSMHQMQKKIEDRDRFGSKIKTVFGPLNISGVLFNVYNMQQVQQRLKNIDVSGAIVYLDKRPKHKLSKFNTLEHALNVLWLVKYFGGDSENMEVKKSLLAEEVAALTKDLSRPVFSQSASVVFQTKSFQDNAHHQECLKKTEISRIIVGYDLTEELVTPGNKEFKLLEQPFPNMCANNIAYNVQLALNLKLVHESYAKSVIKNLRCENGRWYFISRKIAKKFANVQLKLIKKYWCRLDYAVIYHVTNLALKRAWQLQRITEEDMQSCTDLEILQKLIKCNDKTLKRIIAKAGFINKSYRILKNGEGTPDFRPQFEFIGIDPLVYNKHTKECKKLTELDEDFAKRFQQAKKDCQNPPKIQLSIN